MYVIQVQGTMEMSKVGLLRLCGERVNCLGSLYRFINEGSDQFVQRSLHPIARL